MSLSLHKISATLSDEGWYARAQLCERLGLYGTDSIVLPHKIGLLLHSLLLGIVGAKFSNSSGHSQLAVFSVQQRFQDTEMISPFVVLLLNMARK